MSITSLLALRVTPESLDSAPALMTEVLAATRAFEGNLGVTITVDTADATHFVIVEHWDSLEHDDAYRAWRQTPEGASALGSILAEAPVLTRLQDTDY